MVETAAILKKSPGRDYFEFIIHLDEEMYPDSVRMYISPAPEDVALEVSVDIVNWTPVAMVILTSEEPGMRHVELDIGDRAPAQYLLGDAAINPASQPSVSVSGHNQQVYALSLDKFQDALGRFARGNGRFDS